METLSEREKEIFSAAQQNSSIHEVARRFNTVPGAIMGEFESAKKRVEALSAAEPACVKSITSKRIIEVLQGILPHRKNLSPNVINFQEQHL